MADVTARLRRRVESDFPSPGAASAAIAELEELSSERAQAAAVFWAAGDDRRLRDAVALGKTDVRDLIVRGGLERGNFAEVLARELGSR